MALSEEQRRAFERLTPRRLRILAALASGAGVREIAEHLGYSYHGLRAHVRQLQELTGCSSARELARWWVAVRGDYYRWVAEVLGLDA